MSSRLEIADRQQHVRVETVVAGGDADREIGLSALRVETQPLDRPERHPLAQQLPVAREHRRGTAVVRSHDGDSLDRNRGQYRLEYLVHRAPAGPSAEVGQWPSGAAVG